jgi:hypothetical protein
MSRAIFTVIIARPTENLFLNIKLIYFEIMFFFFLKQSGALCGRIKVSSDYVARAPVILNKYQKACCGVSNSGSSSTTLDNRKQRADHWSPIPLSSIEIASLPLLAVPAALIASTVCVGMPKGSKVY